MLLSNTVVPRQLSCTIGTLRSPLPTLTPTRSQLKQSTQACKALNHPTTTPNGTEAVAFDQGHACMMIEFDVGTYTIEADLIMESKVTDQKPSNNLVSMEKEVRNNLPVISSLDLVTQGDLFLGMEGMLEFEVSVFDADDVTGEGLTYTWVGGASSTPLAGCGGVGGVARTCTTPIIQEFVTLFPVDVTVTDAHGGSVTETIGHNLERWSQQTRPTVESQWTMP